MTGLDGGGGRWRDELKRKEEELMEMNNSAPTEWARGWGWRWKKVWGDKW